MPSGKKTRKGKGKKSGQEKGKGKGKGTGKGKGKKAVDLEKDIEMRQLLKTYEKNCFQTNSKVCPGIRKMLKNAAVEGKLATKFIFESVPVGNEGDLPVLFDPFITSLRQERYKHVQDIHVWDYPMTFENIATLALFLEKPFYPIRILELLDCLIDAPAVFRLVRPINDCYFLTMLILDYNEFGDEGCRNLCAGLEGNKTMLSLSLCYCDLRVASGQYLGHIVSTTTIRELFLDGNELQCEGAVELIKLCVDQAEIEAYQREEEAKKKAEETMKAELEKQHKYDGTANGDGSTSEKDVNSLSEKKGIKKTKKKGKGKKKAKKAKEPPPVGPWLYKLHLADNGIDGFGDGGSFAPIICMRLFKKLIMNSKCLQELDLEDNSIGELGGREIMDGLKYRKEIKLGGCKVRTIHTTTVDTFNSIVKYGNQMPKKGKGKRRKGKKKK